MLHVSKLHNGYIMTVNIEFVVSLYDTIYTHTNVFFNITTISKHETVHALIRRAHRVYYMYPYCKRTYASRTQSMLQVSIM